MMIVGCFFLCESICQGEELNCSATFLGFYRKDFTLSGQPTDGSQDFGFRQFGFFLQLGKITHRFRAMRSIQNRHWLQSN